MATPRVPAHLGNKAQKLWRETVAAYDLRVDELRILEDACREVDLIERLEDEIRKLPRLTVDGSMGQPVISELVKDVRQHRNTLKALLAGLKLNEAGEQAGNRSTSARGAAQARWRRGA